MPHVDVYMHLPPPDDHFQKSVTSQPEFKRPSGWFFEETLIPVPHFFSLSLTLPHQPEKDEEENKEEEEERGPANDETG